MNKDALSFADVERQCLDTVNKCKADPTCIEHLQQLLRREQHTGCKALTVAQYIVKEFATMVKKVRIHDDKFLGIALVWQDFVDTEDRVLRIADNRNHPYNYQYVEKQIEHMLRECSARNDDINTFLKTPSPIDGSVEVKLLSKYLTRFLYEHQGLCELYAKSHHQELVKACLEAHGVTIHKKVVKVK